MSREKHLDLTLKVLPSGAVKLSIGEQPVGLIEEISIEISMDLIPRIKVTFISTRGLPEGPDKEYIIRQINRHREVLSQHPYVEIFDNADTLPSMRSVRVGEEDELPETDR